MTVVVTLFAGNLLPGERRLCAEIRFVLVVQDEEGRPVIVKAFTTDGSKEI